MRHLLVVVVGLTLAAPVAAQDKKDSGPVLDLPNEDDESSRTDLTANLAEKTSRMVHSTTVGGYGEVEFHKEQGKDSFFVSHRYVLFFYSQISDRISTSTELELEFGGSPAKRDGVQKAGEAILEFSVVDFKLTDWLILRGGVLLVPFGAFNIRHDSPTRDLTERPKPLTTITPTTWFEVGAGFLGEIPLGDTQSLSYELYVINGLDAKITQEHGMKGAVGSKGEDNNDDKAVAARLAYSPMLGLEIAASGYTGEYDDSGNRVHMVGGDLTWRFGRFELLAEYVRAFIDEGFVEGFSPSSPANTRTPVPTDMQGFYVQTNIHFQIPGLWDLLPDDLSDSQLTGVLRYEMADTNMDEDNQFDIQKLTFGLNYRPVEAYVLKNEVQLVTRSEGGESRHLFTGEFDPTWKYVASMAFLF